MRAPTVLKGRILVGEDNIYHKIVNYVSSRSVSYLTTLYIISSPTEIVFVRLIPLAVRRNIFAEFI